MEEGYFESDLRKRRIALYRNLTRFFAAPLRRRYLEVDASGLENLQKSRSSVLAMHHELGIDGWIVASLLQERDKQKVHYLTQKEGIFTSCWGSLMLELEEIHLSIDKTKKRDIAKAIIEAGDYLNNTQDHVGVFNDGPFATIINLNREALPLKDRLNYPIAATIAKKYDKPLIPIAEWCAEQHRKALCFWWMAGGIRTIWRNLLYMERNKPMEYKIAFLLPLNPNDFSKVIDLADEVRKKQIELYDQIIED